MTRPMLRHAAVLLLVLLIPVASLAMGDLTGEGAVTRIPEPSLDYRVRVTDTEMNQFVVVKVSFQGHVYLSGTVGKARVSVPFDKIRKVIFEPMQNGDVLAVVTLDTGRQQSLTVRGDIPCYGLADFGNVSIQLSDLRDAEFLGRVRAAPPAPEDPTPAQ